MEAAAGRDVRHRAIADALRAEIMAGRPTVGDPLPGEHELSVRFSSSRHTVREALRTLVRDGLIERRQGAATRVIADRPRGPYQPAMNSVQDLRQYAAETVLQVNAVTLAAPTAVEAALLGRRPRERWIRVDATRWAGAEVICVNRVFIHPRFQGLLPDLLPGATLTSGINEMVSSRSGVDMTAVEQDITARPMPGKVARPLMLRPGSAALLFVRRYCDATGDALVWSLNWHPGERFVYRVRLQHERSRPGPGRESKKR